MKYTSIAVLALIGAVEARHHHHQNQVIGNVLAQHKAGGHHHARSHLRSRDSFNMDPDTVSEYDSITGPDQHATYITGRETRAEPGPEDDHDLAEDTPIWDHPVHFRISQYSQPQYQRAQEAGIPYGRQLRAQVRDSFDGAEWTVSAQDSITGPDQTTRAQPSKGDPNSIDLDSFDDGVNVQRRHHKSHKDTFDSDPNTVSPYDGMHGAEYTPNKFEGVQQKNRHHHKHNYQPKNFEGVMIWQDAEIALGKNSTDEYDHDTNTVSQYDADKQHAYEKFHDKKAENKMTWSNSAAGKQYSATQVNSTTNATLVSNMSRNVTANQTANITSNASKNMSANVTGNQTLAFVNKTANVTANKTVSANVSANATMFSAANLTAIASYERDLLKLTANTTSNKTSYKAVSIASMGRFL